MLPEILIFDTYSIMLFIGVCFCFLLFYKYAKKEKMDKDYIYHILILGCICVGVGIITSSLFQQLFDYLKTKEAQSFGAMTFFGGLLGGAITFILIYFLYTKKKYKDCDFLKILIIAPSCITIAHAWGRIGCFCAGCCYGIETDSWLGVTFPGMDHAVYPTQLFESAFLFILSGVLFYLAYKKHFKYTMPIYLLAYGIFRFFIEFIRGDDRGAYLFNILSPSQVFSIVAIITSIILTFYLRKKKI